MKADEQKLAALLASLEAEDGEDDFSMRTTYTYLLGVYLAVNAIRDAFLLVEGPDCTYMKAQYIQGNHDWLSTLTSVSGFHRLANTALHPAMMTASREEPLEALMERMAGHEEVAGLLLTSMPMAFITGADHERLCRDVAERTGKDVIHVPGLSLSGDWLDGYAQTLKSLAKQLDLSGGAPDARRVAIVGYLFDRNEEDHQANLRVLEDMCGALDLELVSIWLSGQRFSELARVRDAGTILSLPYGRAAARFVARQTGAELIEMPLPFGLTASEHWMQQLGARFGREAQAARYCDRHMDAIAPKIEWLIPYLFQNLEVGYVGDPHLLPGVRDIVDLLGGRLRFATITNRPQHVDREAFAHDSLDLLVWPKLKAFIRHTARNILDHHIRLLVTNNYGVTLPLSDLAVVEFGFPSVYNHALFERPFLGHRGFMAFVDDLARAIQRSELERMRPK